MSKLAKKKLVTYVALLRGINVGGNSLIKMSDLATLFRSLRFVDVQTYIQSGNVVFKDTNTDTRKIEASVERAIAKSYPFTPKVLVRNLREMESLVKAIPKTWDDPRKKYNVIFLRPSIDSKKIIEGLNPKDGIEEVIYRPGVLLWSANTSDLSRTSMVKLSTKGIYQEMTVRNLNTTKKLLELMRESDSL